MLTGTDDALAVRDLRLLRDLYRALADPTRLRICAILTGGGRMSVSELSARVGLSQPLMSWHLRVLRLAGLIETRRHGRETLCVIRPAAFSALAAAQQRLVAGELRIAAARRLDTTRLADVR